MKTLLFFFLLATIASAQSVAPGASPALSKDEIIAKAREQIAEQRALAAQQAQAQNAARKKEKAELAAYQWTLEHATKIVGQIVELQPEGYRILGQRIIDGKMTGEAQSFLLIGYPKPAKFGDRIEVLTQPDGEITYKAATGFDATIPKVKYIQPR